MTSEPLILGFDTSGPHCSVAVTRGGDVLAYRHEEMSKGQAERLMDLIGDTLQQAGATYADLVAIGVGVGPGNFTGIRIGVSAARGLALGLGCPAVGISGFDALRFGTDGPCGCAIDARRDQVYLQLVDAKGNSTAPKIVDRAHLPAFDGPLIGAGGQAPAHPAAIAIAHLTAARHTTETARPAPLYIRPADAAPSREAAPTLLP